MRPSDAKLSAALHEAGLEEMAIRAGHGYYNEFFGPLSTPQLTLATELTAVGTPAALAVRTRLMDGEFDADFEESEEWAQSEDGQDTMHRLMNGG